MTALENSPVHGTAVAVGERGFLILGPSGSGKSGLALAMIALGAALVSDDQVVLQADCDGVSLTAPDPIIGQIEARFVGVLQTDVQRVARLAFVVDLAQAAETRMPQLQTIAVLNHRIDLINGQNVPNLASVLMILGKGGRVK
jgi:HPr kinase/phosphorylase